MADRTFSIVKPDAVAKHGIGPVLARIEEGGLRVVAGRMTRLTRAQAESFYAVHKERPFYSDLCDFMTSGPVFVSVLEGDNAIARYREILGATNPADAAAGTVRADFGTDVEKNAAHGSDGPDTAKEEISFFFPAADLS
ncbi:MAG: nucleoside-diphosphate kinase [Candidatus Binatia bacterium]|nr:nucleoside-diphosphate kinase [Candidatus Binatia bacterium]